MGGEVQPAGAGQPREISAETLEAEARAVPGDGGLQCRVGWRLYGLGHYVEALRILGVAASRFPQDIEIAYLLGLCQKRLGDKPGARQSFQQVVKLVGYLEDKTRAGMLRRLAVGQVNMLELGRWNLEPETWVRT